MITAVAEFAGGIALAAAYLGATARPHSLQRALQANVLWGVAGAYLAFAAAGGAMAWLPLEIAGVFGFGAAAELGRWVSPWWLVAGWAAHPAWDVLHLAKGGDEFVPVWYMVACISFDWTVAAVLARKVAAVQRKRVR